MRCNHNARAFVPKTLLLLGCQKPEWLDRPGIQAFEHLNCSQLELWQIAQAFEALQLLAHSVILGKVIFVPIQKIPKERGEGAGVFSHPQLRVVGATLAVLSHAVDVGAARSVWLGHQLSAIGVNRHADYVWNHYPIARINELLAHPVEKFLGVSARGESQIAQNH